MLLLSRLQDASCICVVSGANAECCILTEKSRARWWTGEKFMCMCVTIGRDKVGKSFAGKLNGKTLMHSSKCFRKLCTVKHPCNGIVRDVLLNMSYLMIRYPIMCMVVSTLLTEWFCNVEKMFFYQFLLVHWNQTKPVKAMLKIHYVKSHSENATSAVDPCARWFRLTGACTNSAFNERSKRPRVRAAW